MCVIHPTMENTAFKVDASLSQLLNKKTIIRTIDQTRLTIGHSNKMSHGHFMRRDEQVLSQKCGKLLTVKYLLVYCRNLSKTKTNHEFSVHRRCEALKPREDNFKKIISFPTIINNMYNSMYLVSILHLYTHL